MAIGIVRIESASIPRPSEPLVELDTAGIDGRRDRVGLEPPPVFDAGIDLAVIDQPTIAKLQLVGQIEGRKRTTGIRSQVAPEHQLLVT